MPAAKTLADHVRDRTFRARRHHELLDGPVLPIPALASIQARYAASMHALERRAIAVEFGRAVLELPDDVDDEAVREFEALRAVPAVRSDAEFRRAFATELHARGFDLDAIAERFEVSSRTVRGWLRTEGSLARARARPSRTARTSRKR